MNKEWEWRFLLSWLMKAIKGMTQEEKGDFLDDTIIALQARERGVNDFADTLIARADALSQKQRDNRGGGWKGDCQTTEPPTMVNHGVPPSTMVNHGETTAHHGRTYENEDEDEKRKTKMKTENENQPPSPASGGGRGGEVGTMRTPAAWQVSDDKSRVESRTIGNALGTLGGGGTPGPSKSGPSDPIADALARIRAGDREAIWDAGAVPNAILPELATAYCGERSNRRAVGIYGTACKKVGYPVFREELAAFISECESGEEPGDRGRAFMARLKKLPGL